VIRETSDLPPACGSHGLQTGVIRRAFRMAVTPGHEPEYIRRHQPIWPDLEATLLAYGVRTLRNGERPYDVIGQARRIVLAAIEKHSPQIVAIEEPLMLPTKRAALMSVIAQELRGRAEELNLEVVEMSPHAIREAVVGNARATKIDVAEALVRMGFDQLKSLVPKRPARAALGLRPRDKYWLHMFDALALAVASTADPRRSESTEVTTSSSASITNLSEPGAESMKPADH